MRAWLFPALIVLAALAVWLVVGDGFGGAEDGVAPTAGGEEDDPALVGLEGGPPLDEPGNDVADDAGPQIEIPPWPIGELESDESGTGRVFVRLVDGFGQPLPNHPIEVAWWKAWGVYGDTAGRTDAEGRYQSDADEPWQIESVAVPMVADRPETSLYYSDTFAAAPSRPDEVVVEMPVTVRVRGRVVDLTGDPVSTLVQCDAFSTLDEDPFLFRMRVNDREARSDENGRFELLLVAGRYQLSLSQLPATSNVQLHLDAKRRDVEVELVVGRPLPEGRRVEVVFKGAAPEVLAKVGATLRTDAPVFGLPSGTSGVAHSPREQLLRVREKKPGQCVFDPVPGDPWTAFVWVPGTGMIKHPVPAGATRVEVPIVVKAPKRERTIRVVGRLPDGTLVRPTVQPYKGDDMLGGGVFSGPYDDVEGEPVRLDEDDGVVHLVVSDTKSGYVGVGPIDVESAPDRIEVPLEERREGRVEFADASGNPVAATFELSPAWALFRSVLLSGQTEPSTRPGYAPVVLDLHRTISDDGWVTFGMLGSTPYAVVARPQDGDLPPARGILRAGETLRLTVGEGSTPRSISGRVVDATSGQPISAARVESFRTDAVNETDAEGRFVLTGLDPGPQEVRVFAHHYAFPRFDPVDVSEGSATIEVALEPARRVPLRILDDEGAPVRAVISMFDARDRVVIFKDQYGNYDGDVQETDRAGRVDLLGVPAGHVIVVVDHSSTAEPQRFELDAHAPFDRLVTLRLEP